MIYIILLVGFLLRLVNADQSFWLDEASQALMAQRSLGDIIFNNSADFQPPLSYILSHFWIQFGHSEVWLRLLPILFGVGSIWIIYLLGKKLFERKIGLLSAFMLAIAPYHIYYSQEFRMYSMVTFFGLVSTYYFVKLIKESSPTSKKNTSFFIASSTLIMFTHYLGVMVLISQFSYLLFFERRLIKKLVGAYAAVGIIFAFWLPYFFQQLSHGVSADSYLPGWSQMLSMSFYKAIPLLVTKFMIGRIDFDNNVVYSIIIIVVFLVIGIIFAPIVKKINEKNIGLLICLFLIPIILTFLFSFKLPMFQPFRLLLTLPYFLILLSFGISQYKKMNNLLLGVVCFIFVGGYLWLNLNQRYLREDWRTAVLVANKFVKSQEYGRVLFAWPENFAPYSFYSERNLGTGIIQKMPGSLELTDDRLLKENLGERVVYFSYLDQLSDPNKTIQEWLEMHDYKLVETKDFRGVGLVYFYLLKSQTIGLKSN